MKSYRSWFPAYCTGEALDEENEEREKYTANHSFFLTEDEEINITLHLDQEMNQMPRSVPHADVVHVDLLQRAKMYLQTIDEISYRELRNEANRYEGLGKGCFLNRSAMKLVNLDYEFALVAPFLTEDYEEENDQRVFTFVDLCGGPGGFIEYCVLKCRHERIRCLGFGMTLLIPNDGMARVSMRSCNWNVAHLHDPPLSQIVAHNSNESNAVMTEMIEKDDAMEYGTNTCPIQVYLVDGVTGTGDITKAENIASLQLLMRQRLSTIPPSISSTTHTASTNNIIGSSSSNHNSISSSHPRVMDNNNDPMKYVDFCSADGFDSDMEETFVLVLSQVIAMLTCLNNGGNFVIKLFTCDKPHSLSLFVLLAQLFEELILTKPVTSRPISGERFLTAFRLRECVTEGIRQMVIDQLWGVCQRLESWTATQRDNLSVNIPMQLELEHHEIDGEDPDHRVFRIMQWPFVIPDAAVHAASEYLTAVNGHHLLVQVMESYKILSTALERGLLGTKQGVDHGLLIYPRSIEEEAGGSGVDGMSSVEGGEVSVEIIQLVNTLGNIRIREAGNSSSNSSQHTTMSGGKKKKKKRRGNKTMVVDMELADDPAGVPVTDVDSETVFMTSAAAATTATATVSDNDHHMSTQKVGSHKGGVVNDGCRSIKDIVRQEQMSKPLRVHEYFKLWNIYELDVVY